MWLTCRTQKPLIFLASSKSTSLSSLEGLHTCIASSLFHHTSSLLLLSHLRAVCRLWPYRSASQHQSERCSTTSRMEIWYIRFITLFISQTRREMGICCSRWLEELFFPSPKPSPSWCDEREFNTPPPIPVYPPKIAKTRIGVPPLAKRIPELDANPLTQAYQKREASYSSMGPYRLQHPFINPHHMDDGGRPSASR